MDAFTVSAHSIAAESIKATRYSLLFVAIHTAEYVVPRMQVGHLNDRDMKQLAMRKGQLAVTLSELNRKSDENFDALAFLKTFRRASNLWVDTEPFQDRLQVSTAVSLCELNSSYCLCTCI